MKKKTAQADQLPIESIMLKYTFNDDEILALGQQSAQMVRDIVNKKNELDAIKKEYMAEIKELNAKVDLTAEHITNGFKMERVSCRFTEDSTHRRYWTEDQNPDIDPPVHQKAVQQGHQYSAL